MEKNNVVEKNMVVRKLVGVCGGYVKLVGEFDYMIMKKWGMVGKYNEEIGKIVRGLSEDMWEVIEKECEGYDEEEIMDEVKKEVWNGLNYGCEANVYDWIFEKNEVMI